MEKKNCNKDDPLKTDDLNMEGDGLLNDAIIGEASEIVVVMKFKSKEEVFEFYKRYAYHVGFPVRKRNSKKDANRVVLYVSFTSSREGRRASNTSTSLKPHPIGQTGCKVGLSTTSDAAGVWRITGVHLEHNHQTSPYRSRVF